MYVEYINKELLGSINVDPLHGVYTVGITCNGQ